MSSAATQFIQETYRKPYLPTILRRIAASDQLAIEKRSDLYGDFISALARKFTASSEEAEATVLEIYTDIQRYAECGDLVPSFEQQLISAIAMRRLIQSLQYANQNLCDE